MLRNPSLQTAGVEVPYVQRRVFLSTLETFGKIKGPIPNVTDMHDFISGFRWCKSQRWMEINHNQPLNCSHGRQDAHMRPVVNKILCYGFLQAGNETVFTHFFARIATWEHDISIFASFWCQEETMEKANNAYHLGLDLSEYAKASISKDHFHGPHVPTARAVSQVHSNLSHLIHTNMMCEFTQVTPIQLKRNEEWSRGQRPPQRQWCARSRLFANALSTRVEQPYRYIGIYIENMNMTSMTMTMFWIIFGKLVCASQFEPNLNLHTSSH